MHANVSSLSLLKERERELLNRYLYFSLALSLKTLGLETGYFGRMREETVSTVFSSEIEMKVGSQRDV